MEITEVVQRPDTYKAVRFMGIADPEIVEWSGGSLKPNTNAGMVGDWDLHIQTRDGLTRAYPGMWVIMDHRGNFHVTNDQEFKTYYITAPKSFDGSAE